jgi:hypothetical protein
MGHAVKEQAMSITAVFAGIDVSKSIWRLPYVRKKLSGGARTQTLDQKRLQLG